MPNIFTRHPHSVGETYWQHAKFASIFGGKMFCAGLACLIHAIFPFLFVQTGSKGLLKLLERYLERTPEGQEKIIALTQRRSKVSR